VRQPGTIEVGGWGAKLDHWCVRNKTVDGRGARLLMHTTYLT